MDVATFAAGCFWGVEDYFRRIKGISHTRVGYTGGNVNSPTYEQVCSGTTGHAEAVEILFDPSAITYPQLLAAFWLCHDPTTLNRQGPDTGTQYRSAIFYFNEIQHKQAKASLQLVTTSKQFIKPVVTEISPAGPFWPAEAYHQQYLQKKREE